MLVFLGFNWDCVNISLYPCILVSLYPCILVLLYHCIIASLCYCVIASLYHCIIAPLHHCIIVLVCYCVIVLLCYCVIVLLCYCMDEEWKGISNKEEWISVSVVSIVFSEHAMEGCSCLAVEWCCSMDMARSGHRTSFRRRLHRPC